MIAMVLAAGFGTRLRPLTDRIAKPALPILGTTLLAANLHMVKRAGATEVVVNAHHLPGTVAAAARRAADALGLTLHLSFESAAILGTGGALAAARPLLDRGAPFLLVNGDVLSDVDASAAVRAHAASRAATTMVLRPLPPGAPFALVEVDEGGRVARIAGLGRPVRETERLTAHLFTGVHVLGPAIFSVLPPSGESCVNRQGHVRLLEQGFHVHAHLEAGGAWSDVGTPERYVAANLDLLRGKLSPEAIGDPRGAARPGAGGALVDPTATVEPGARLEAPCFVGPGARGAAPARLGPGAVVLEGATVAGEVIEAVVGPGATVRAGVRLEGSLAT